jgi:secondary thiamine-phosphate synthase enzyme
MTVRNRSDDEGGAVVGRSAISSVTPNAIATATLVIETRGRGFTEFTREAERFVADARAGEGVLHLFLCHTSASLMIQENADPDVQVDLLTALERIAPANAGWVHGAEGPDDMPAHVKAMVAGISLQVPVVDGRLALGTWQGVYLVEHRTRPHRREVVLQFIGSRR